MFFNKLWVVFIFKRTNNMKIFKISLISLFFAVIAANSQSFSVFDIDTTNFPIMSAKFYAFDKDGNQLKDFQTTDFEITENEEPRTVLSVTCPPDKPPVAISSVLTIDVSGSMTGNNQDMAEAAATAWINALPLGQSECCITTFDTRNSFLQDFTKDRNKLLNAINNLHSNGGTSFDAGFINPVAGGMLAAKNGKYKRVLVFMTDGFGSGNESEIINQANANDVTVFCVTLGYKCPDLLKNIANQTGGKWFENVTTTKEAEDVYRNILSMSQNLEPCTIEWESNLNCIRNQINLYILSNIYKLSHSESYIPPKKSIARLEITPKGIHFLNKEPLIQCDTTITITAINSNFNVSKITSSDPNYKIIPNSFFLAKGDSRNLSLSFTPSDSNRYYTDIVFENDLCNKKYYSVGLFLGRKNNSTTLKLTHPNGGEKFIAGSDSIIKWTGVLSSDKIKLEYSFDGGASWNLITEEATGLEYVWNDIPLPTSSECLVRINYNQVAPVIEWEKTYGGSKSDILTDLRQTNDGGIIFSSYSNSTDGDIKDNKGYEDGLVFKLNNLGEIEWQEGFRYKDKEKVLGIEQTDDGGYIFFGLVLNEFIETNPNKSGAMYVVRKISHDGKTEWTKSYGSLGYDFALAFIKTDDEGCVIGGSTPWKTGDVDDNYGKSDIWIVKIDSKGNLIWDKNYGGEEGDSCTDIIPTGDNGYIVAGFTRSSTNDVSKNQGFDDFLVLKLDRNGNIEWERTFGGERNDYAHSIQPTLDNGYIVAGYSTSKHGDLEGSTFDHGHWIIKLDNNGDLLWQTRIPLISYKFMGLHYEPYNCKIIETSDGSFLLAGGSIENNIDSSKSHGGYDFFVAKLDFNGVLLWSKFYGGSKDDFATSIIKSNEGGYLVGGFTSSDNGDVSENKGKEDCWIVKLSSEGYPQSDTSDTFFSIVAPEVEAMEVYMGEVLVGSTRDSMIVDFVKSKGSYRCRIDSISIKTMDEENFLAFSSLPANVDKFNPKQAAEFRFMPDKVGDFESLIYVFTQADTLEYRIYGKGVENNLDVYSKVIDFGKVAINNHKDTIRVLLTNIGDLDINIDKTTIVGPDTEQFEVLDGGGSFTISTTNNERELEIRFAPKEVIRTSSRIEFKYAGIGSPAMAYLYGEGVHSPASMSMLPDTLDFGKILVNNSKDSSEVLISNLTDQELYITKMELVGSGKDMFEFIDEDSVYAIIGLDSRKLKMRFQPDQVGIYEGQVAFHYAGIGSPAMAYLYGAGIGGKISVTSDSCFAGEKRVFKLYFGGVKLEKFAELVDSYSGILRVEKTLLAPTDATKLYKITEDSTYIEFSGNLDPNNAAIAEIEMIAGLGRVQSTSIDIEEIKWFSKGEEIEYENENESGLFTLLGICEEGGERLLNPNGEISMEVMPNPTGDELKVVLNLIEKGDSELIITNSSGKEIYRKTISCKAKNLEIKIDLSGTEQGAYFISLQTPTTKIDKSFVRVK
jgi:VWFA-related protein